jgi:hypothetical protein
MQKKQLTPKDWLVDGDAAFALRDVDGDATFALRDVYDGWFYIEGANGNEINYLHRDEIRVLAEYAGFTVTEKRDAD